MCKPFVIVFVLFSLFVGSQAFADTEGADGRSSSSSKLEELVVTAKQQKKDEFTAVPVNQLSGDELTIKINSTLGATLAQEAGVHNASFGPGVGIPILRGFSGVRVKMLEDGVSTWDGSNLSPDHAVAIEPVLATQIDVIKGAATAQYGSGAIGGVVKVNTHRLPKEPLEKDIMGSVELRSELINDHNLFSRAGQINLQSGNNIFHIDAYKRSQKDTSIPSKAIDVGLVNEQYGFDASTGNTDGYIANTDANTDGFALGFSRLLDNWQFGLSHRQLQNNYGLPPGSHTEPRNAGGVHNHGAGAKSEPFIGIDMQQKRHDVFMAYMPETSMLKKAEIQMATINYQHIESEEGRSGTFFENKVTELLFNVEHQGYGLGSNLYLEDSFQGMLGVHIVDREFAAKGVENFIPATSVKQLALFFIENYQADNFLYQFSIRGEKVSIEQQDYTSPLLPDFLQFKFSEIIFKNFHIQSVIDIDLNEQHKLNASFAVSERNPDVQELFSLGAHLATRSYDMGFLIRQNEPKKERLHDFSISWEWSNDQFEQELQLFYKSIKHFVFQQNTGAYYDLSEQFFRVSCVRIAECLPVYEYQQQDAVFTGFEWSLDLSPWEYDRFSHQLVFFADAVKGRFDNDQDVPRMPPLRYGVNTEFIGDDWNANLRLSFYEKQSRAGEFETQTAGYHNLSASFNKQLMIKDTEALIFLRANNLSNQTIRHASSFLRNFAPEPGRSLEAGISVSF